MSWWPGPRCGAAAHVVGVLHVIVRQILCSIANARQGARHLGPDLRQDDECGEAVCFAHGAHRSLRSLRHTTSGVRDVVTLSAEHGNIRVQWGRANGAAPVRALGRDAVSQAAAVESPTTPHGVIPVRVTGIHRAAGSKLRFAAQRCHKHPWSSKRIDGCRQRVPA